MDERLTARLGEGLAVRLPERRRPRRRDDGLDHPAAMLFVRCRGGISHNPAESVEEADVAVAIDVLERFLRAV